MSKYYYHPLGDFAQYYIDNEISSSNANIFPHTYSGHGWGKLDWGVGANVPVYSMTDGIITSVNSRSSSEQRGYVVVVRTDRTDSEGKTIYIRYLELGGLSEITAPLVTSTTITPGPNTQNYQNFTTSTEAPIKMGQLIGYTNNWYDGYSNLHLDFTYGDNYVGKGESVNFGSPTSVPHANSLSSEFTYDSNTGKVTCNGNVVGTENGQVPTRNNSTVGYTVYPCISYLTCLQKPIKIVSNTTINPDGGISISDGALPNNSSDMNQECLNFYLKEKMSDNWMGSYPNSLDDLNNNQNCRGIRYATAICSMELAFETFSEVSYAKLLRAKMIGESWNNAKTMKQWFENLNPNQFAKKDVWTKKTFSSSESLLKAQLIYKNICFPDIYGSEYFKGEESFKKAIIRACRQIPIYNLSPIPSSYGPFAFVVNYNTKTGKDEGQSGGSGNYLLYRSVKNLKTFNSNIKR